MPSLKDDLDFVNQTYNKYLSSTPKYQEDLDFVNQTFEKYQFQEKPELPEIQPQVTSDFDFMDTSTIAEPDQVSFKKLKEVFPKFKEDIKQLPELIKAGLYKTGSVMTKVPKTLTDIADNIQFKFGEFMHKNPKLQAKLGLYKDPTYSASRWLTTPEKKPIKEFFQSAIDEFDKLAANEMEAVPEEIQRAKWIDRPIYKTLEAFTNTAPQLALATVLAKTGNPKMAIGMLSGMAGASQYQEALEATKNPDEAFKVGLASFIMNVVTEKVMPEIAKNKTGMREVIKIGGMSSLQEVVQGGLDDAISLATYNPDAKPLDVEARLSDAVGGFFASAGPASNTIYNKVMKKGLATEFDAKTKVEPDAKQQETVTEDQKINKFKEEFVDKFKRKTKKGKKTTDDIITEKVVNSIYKDYNKSKKIATEKTLSRKKFEDLTGEKIKKDSMFASKDARSKFHSELKELIKEFEYSKKIPDETAKDVKQPEYKTDEPKLDKPFDSKSKTKAFEKIKTPEKTENIEQEAYNYVKQDLKVKSIDKNSKNFKMFEKSYELAKKYAKRIGERYVPKKSYGVYYPKTENILVNSLNNIATVSHEIMHHIDSTSGLVNKIKSQIGISKTGKPVYNLKTNKVEKELLTDFYVNFYGGKKTDALQKRLEEGLAKFVDKYITEPHIFENTNKYDPLIKMFLKKGGKYNTPLLNEYIKDAKNVIKEFNELNSLYKVGARVLDNERTVDKNQFLNLGDKAQIETLDDIWFMEKFAKEAGVEMTTKDPSLLFRMNNNLNAVINENIESNKEYWRFNGDSINKEHNFGINTILKKLKKKKMVNEFGYFLVARRAYFDFQKLDKLKTQLDEAKEKLKGLDKKSDKYKDALEKLEEVKRAYNIQERIVKSDKFTRNDIESAYNDNKDFFSDEIHMYDSINRSHLDTMLDAQLITPEEHKRYYQESGYASFQRDFINDILGEQIMHKIKGKKISSLMQRKGSQGVIINPLISLIKAEQEIVRKSMRQVIYNKIHKNIAKKFPDLFQNVELDINIDKDTGKIFFPQEQDKNIIMARDNFKRKPMIVNDANVKQMIDSLLNYSNINFMEKMMTKSAKAFTAGTTGYFAPFAAINIVIDQLTAIAQTQTSYVPLYSQLKLLYKELQNSDSKPSQFAKEYLKIVGLRQTYVGQYDTPAKQYEYLKGEQDKVQKTTNFLNKAFDAGLSFLSSPSVASEVITRMTEYVNARLKGYDQFSAIELANRVTAPFTHKGKMGSGSFGKIYIRSLPFLNPALQVLKQSSKSLKSKTNRQRVIFTMLGITSALMGSMAYLIKFGSEEQKKKYKQLHPDFLANYIWLPSPNKKDLWKIRMPEQLAAIGQLINAYIADQYLDAKYTQKNYFDIATNFIPDQLNPMGGARWIFSLIPHLARGFIEVAANIKTWPDVMHLETITQQRLPSEDRKKKTTSTVAVKLARTELAKNLELSPIKLDHLLLHYWGRVIKPLIGKKIYNPFVQSEFYFTGSRQISDYYKISKKVQEDYNQLNNVKKERALTKKEIDDIRLLRAQNRKINRINRLLIRYRKIDADKLETEETINLESRILQSIEELDLQ